MRLYSWVVAVAIGAWLWVGVTALRAGELVPCPDCIAGIPAVGDSGSGYVENGVRDPKVGKAKPMARGAVAIWRCVGELGVVVYSRAWCPESGRRVDGVEANTWAWARAVKEKPRADAVDRVAAAPAPATASGGSGRAWGMGPANSAKYLSCSGAACDLIFVGKGLSW